MTTCEQVAGMEMTRILPCSSLLLTDSDGQLCQLERGVTFSIYATADSNKLQWYVLRRALLHFSFGESSRLRLFTTICGGRPFRSNTRDYGGIAVA